MLISFYTLTFIIFSLQILNAGKHLCIENPFVLTFEDGKRLFDIAEQFQSVIHVQHTALLSTAHHVLKKWIEEKLSNGVKVKTLEIGFMGNVLPKSWGTLPFTGITRLHM